MESDHKVKKRLRSMRIFSSLVTREIDIVIRGVTWPLLRWGIEDNEVSVTADHWLNGIAVSLRPVQPHGDPQG